MMIDLPERCFDCNALLMGSWTQHTEACSVGRLIRQFKAEVAEAVIPSITCPQCGLESYNANDIRERYCGHCHEWHGEMRPTDG